MALALLIVRELFELSALFLVAQFAVGLFNWQRRNQNPVYQMLAIATRPVLRVARLITPRLIIDAHVPIVAFLLLLFGFFAIGWWWRDVCLADLAQNGCARWAAARAAGR